MQDTALVQFAKAFQLWEEDFRANPTKYMTEEEVSNSEVSEVSISRAEYFNELLNVVNQQGA